MPNLLKSSLWRLKGKIEKLNLEKFKGSFRDPFFCLKLVSFILFGAVVFMPAQFEAPFLDNGGLNLISGNQSRESQLFVSPGTVVRESPEFCLIQENSLTGSSPPIMVTPQVLGAIVGGIELETETEKEIIEYEVEQGDSFWSITNRFGISLNTLLWVNDLNKNSLIQPGQKLIILPVSGVMYMIKKGDTLSEIAEAYQGKVDEIMAFNNLPNEGEIFIGDILIIPGGEMPASSSPVQYAPLASSYFICPIPSPCRITQGLHWYNAIDFSNGKCGEPVFAAAGGQVQKTGCGRISGNFVRILHPNGVVTFYGHLSKILVSIGNPVSQGDIIGYTGYSGYTIPQGPAGCHLHFDVRGARNPFAR